MWSKVVGPENASAKASAVSPEAVLRRAAVHDDST